MNFECWKCHNKIIPPNSKWNFLSKKERKTLKKVLENMPTQSGGGAEASSSGSSGFDLSTLEGGVENETIQDPTGV